MRRRWLEYRSRCAAVNVTLARADASLPRKLDRWDHRA